MLKQCWNLNHSTFVLFFGHCQGTCFPKSLSYWHAKSWDFFFTLAADENKKWPSSSFYFRSCGLRKRGRRNSEKSRFRGSFDKQHCKRAQALLKTTSQHLDHIHWSLPSKLSWKKCLLLTCQIFGLLVNTLAADEKYPVLNRDNLTIPIHMQLSQTQKTFF